MSVNTIIVLSGSAGLSAEADERIRRLAIQDELDIQIEKVDTPGGWERMIRQHAGDGKGFVLSPSYQEENADRAALYRTLDNATQSGAVFAEVYEGNIFSAAKEARPLRPGNCHIRLIAGLGAAGYLIAIESLLRAEGLQ